jgi:hypothetical protein
MKERLGVFMCPRVKFLLLLLVLIVACFLFENQIPSPPGMPDRYIFRVRMIGPPLLTNVADSETGEEIFWYDASAGPEVKRIERQENGKWIITLAPRPKQ